VRVPSDARVASFSRTSCHSRVRRTWAPTGNVRPENARTHAGEQRCPVCLVSTLQATKSASGVQLTASVWRPAFRLPRPCAC